MAKGVIMSTCGNVTTNDFYSSMLEIKCSVLKDLIQNQEACDRYEKLSHISNKIETIGGTKWLWLSSMGRK